MRKSFCKHPARLSGIFGEPLESERTITNSSTMRKPPTEVGSTLALNSHGTYPR